MRKDSFAGRVAAKETRRQKARRRGVQSVWVGFGIFGLVGWSVVVPTLAGTALGVWIDGKYPSEHSWTLMLLVFGLIARCANAWHWIEKEAAAIRKEEEDGHE